MTKGQMDPEFSSVTRTQEDKRVYQPSSERALI